MPSIAKIRFTNVIYDNKHKRFNDDIFNLDGHNAAVLLENGGGKTVIIQCAIQAVIPHADLGERKIKETLLLDNTCAHIAIEWILKDRPRKYCVTAVSLYKDSNGSVASYRFINEYGGDSKDAIELIPFALNAADGRKRPASREEIGEYYAKAKAGSMAARTFSTIQEYQNALAKDYGIIASEWRSQLAINKKEGGVEEFFDGCTTTGHLVDNLLIPSIEAVIAGDGEKGFAKTFENQRDTFKEYNRLTRLIMESDLATERLNAYVKEYETLKERQRETLKMQRQAKALRKLADEEINGLVELCDQLGEQKEALKRERETLLYKQESMAVLDSESEQLAAAKDLTEAKAVFEKRQEIYDEKAARKESIELRRAEHELKEWESKIQSVNEEMLRLEEDTDIDELRDMYGRHAGQLRGCYLGLEESLHKKLAYIDLHLKKNVNEKALFNSELEAENKKIGDLRAKKSEQQGACAANSERIAELKRKILIDVKNERVEEALNGYNKRLSEIEGVLSALDSEINQIDKRAAGIKAEQPVVQERRDQVNKQFTELGTELQFIDAKIDKLVAKLSADYKEFYNLRQSNFYSKEKTIRENFEAIIYKAKRAKEETLLSERLKKRLSDAYAGNEYFTGAPELYAIVEGIKNRFSFIQAGGQYVNQAADVLSLPKDEILARFPFWHYAIIVNETDAARLRTELSAKEPACPVLILTLAKARELVEGEDFDLDSVMPGFWVSNLAEESFINWKERIKAQGEAAEAARREAEEVLVRLQEDSGGAREFFADYPYESYRQMGDDKGELETRLNDLTELAETLKKELDGIENARKSAVNSKSDLAQEAAYVNTNREYAQSILKMEGENKSRARDIMQLDEQIVKAETGIGALKRDIEIIKENIEEQKEEKNIVYSQQLILQNEEWYKAVKDAAPDLRGSIPKNALIEKLAALKLELGKMSEERQVLEERLAGHKTNWERAEMLFRSLEKAARYPQEEGYEYHEGMELELTRLSEQLPALQRDRNNQETEVNKRKDIWVGKKALYDDRLTNFKKAYEELYVFQQSPGEAKDALREEEAAISLRTGLLGEELLKAEDEKKKAEKALAKLAEMDREFKFGNVDAESEEFIEALNYSYNRLKVVEEMDMGLQHAFQRMYDEEKKVINAKKIYGEHCRREISDVRNRDKLIELVERADNYEALIEGQKAMNASLGRAKMMAHAALAEREEKMFQFTNHLYTHVEKVAKELLLIPKKTRIHTEDGWKEIFDVSFAGWDEKEARMALRSQINYILDRIENNQDFKTEEGAEDIAKIRVFIEKSLKSKQLLKKIMGSNEIRVRCRKVTNDNQVSNRFYSWEESEKWSGGERWSKNMALFLGIQNYIAEKTEPDLRAGKSKSCVLLDNPFGRASSEHVLNPVFFIAQELGFQIITVTAHAEGKFISDYFPVVYSLKLREASGGKTSVITKELNIRHAYFEDRDPIDIERLMTKEQLVLF